MTRYYQVTDWSDIGDIEQIESNYDRDEDMFFTFEAARGELRAFLLTKATQYIEAANRLEELTVEDVENKNKKADKEPLLPAGEDFTLKDMERIPPDEDDYEEHG